MKKKVLIFSLAYTPFMGGAEIAIKEITDRISDTDFEFHMITVRFNSHLLKEEKIGNVFMHRIGPTISPFFAKVYYQFCASFYAQKLHKKHNYDIIWAMMPHSTGIPSSSFKKKYPNIQYLLTLQEGDTLKQIKRRLNVFYLLYARAFKCADFIQTISTHLVNMAREMGYKGEIKIVPNGVDFKLFSKKYSDEELNELREKHNLKKENHYLITTSRLVHKNGIDDVIRALALLPKNIHFLIVGGGPLRRELGDLAENEGVNGRVHFFLERSYKDIPKYLALADIFIRPSRSEGMGNSFIEAMAAGIPVIGTQVGGIVDFLYDGKTGFVCEVNNPMSIANKVKYIIDSNNKGAVANIIESAKKLTEKYDWGIVAFQMKSIFVKLS